MDVNFFYNLSNNNNYLNNFLLNNKKINFINCNIKDLKSLKHKNNMLIIENQTTKKDFNKLVNMIATLDIDNIIYLYPIKFKLEFQNRIKNKILYPINFLQFIDNIQNFFSQNIFLNKNIFLSNDNLLTNSESNKKIYLTEIESKILFLLNKKRILNKYEINEVVLGHKTNIDSKSLDTHLYRLRNKINKVSNDIKIEYDDLRNIRFITTG